ncbi:glycosyltransferase family 2 protein [Jiella sp. M17.18]|uniref:glycosyltransferase n=1 Tax=Jiella sp. M17.18 TaxID=3234247 RepID=UPI0034DF1029
MLSLASFLLVLTIALLVIHAIRQAKALRQLHAEGGSPQEAAPSVTVIVPARDEAENIGPCVSRILAQEGLGRRIDLIAVDDHSTDATAAILEGFAARDPRLTPVSAAALPPDWLGKPHACWAGYSAAGKASDWLCFIDADVRIEPQLLASALAAAEREQLDLLSLAPRQVLGSFAERLIMPMGFYLLSFRQDLVKLQDPANPDATAAGLFILVRRSAYEAAGGHAGVRAAVCEDVELARRVKASGGRVAMWGGDTLLETRMYDGLASIWEGVGKNLVDMLGGPLQTVATVIAANVIIWASIGLPILDGLRLAGGVGLDAQIALGLSVAAFLAVLGFHIAGARHFRVPFWYGLLYPLGYTVGSILALDSVRRRLAGEVSWKGRTYRLPQQRASLGE